jgi:AcrR family transcriptional regulator
VKDKSSVCAEILQSAREELLTNGILGLRVADVAAKSNTSITQIYRFFRNRDGLLARVLGDIYDEQTQVAVDAYLSHLPAERALTIRDLADAIPVELTPELIKVQGLRNQILATSVHNNDLHDRLKVCSQRLLELWTVELEKLQDRMAPGEKFDKININGESLELVSRLDIFKELKNNVGNISSLMSSTMTQIGLYFTGDDWLSDDMSVMKTKNN